MEPTLPGSRAFLSMFRDRDILSIAISLLSILLLLLSIIMTVSKLTFYDYSPKIIFATGIMLAICFYPIRGFQMYRNERKFVNFVNGKIVAWMASRRLFHNSKTSDRIKILLDENELSIAFKIEPLAIRRVLEELSRQQLNGVLFDGQFYYWSKD
jgi:hypothetical protein